MPLGAIPFPFGICRICKDKATGVHYGVTTCEGCKGFFKRSITRGDKYKCFFGSDCDLTPKNRNRCKSCRFKKCLDVGMSVEAVRMGRIPKVEKEKALEVFHQGGSDFQNLEIQVEMTGTGTYDFKINPKDNAENKYQQTGPHRQVPQALMNHDQSQIQSKHLNPIIRNEEISEEKMQSLMEHIPYTTTNDLTQPHVMKNHAQVLSSDYHSYLTNPMVPNRQSYPTGQSTFTSQETSNQQSYPADQRSFTNQMKPTKQSYPSGQRTSTSQEASTQQSFPTGQRSFTNQMTPPQHSYPSGQRSSKSQEAPTQQSFPTGQRSFTNQMKTPQHSYPSGQRSFTSQEATTQQSFPTGQRSFTNQMTTPQHSYPSGQRSFTSQTTPPHQSYLPDQHSCNRSSIVNSQELFHSHPMKQSGMISDNDRALEPYTYAASKLEDNFKVPFDSFTVGDGTSQGTNNKQWQYKKPASAVHHKYHSDFDSNVRQAPYSNPAFSSHTYSSMSTHGMNGKQETHTRADINSQTLQQSNNSEHQCLNRVDQLRLNSGLDHRPYSGHKEEQHQHLLNGNGPYIQNVRNNYDTNLRMKLGHRHTENQPLDIDETVHYVPIQSSDKMDFSEKMLQDVSMNDNTEGFIDNQSGPSNRDISDQSESVDNLRCFSSGSVISRDGSGSSQKSGYSSTIVQILIDQLIESDQVAKFADSLKKKLGTPQADAVEKLLKLVDNKSERSTHSSDNKMLNEIPENKLECINRFFKDLNNDDNKTEAPLLKKKRCIEDTELKDPFENLDVQIPMEVISSNQDFETSGDNAKRLPNHFMTQQQQCDVREVNIPSQEHSSPPNTSYNTTNSKTSANQNLAYSNQHQTLTNDMARNSVQNVSANEITHSNQGVSSRPFTNGVRQMVFNESPDLDNIVSSSIGGDEKTETNTESDVKLVATINCMNLAMKILNRFKPEHREKIRLFKLGQLHIQILTDSDEDCAAIYKKLMEGISGLNDRIIGFCESVPGFLDICKEDREKLVKRSYYDMWTLSYSEYFQNGQSFWILPSGEIYSAEAMRKILNDKMVDTIMTFAESYNKLELTDLETALFSAVRLTTTPTTIELEDVQKVGMLNSYLLDTLAFEIKRNHPGNHMQLLMNIFKLVPLIESINNIQSEIIANFSVKRFSKTADAADENKT